MKFIWQILFLFRFSYFRSKVKAITSESLTTVAHFYYHRILWSDKLIILTSFRNYEIKLSRPSVPFLFIYLFNYNKCSIPVAPLNKSVNNPLTLNGIIIVGIIFRNNPLPRPPPSECSVKYIGAWISPKFKLRPSRRMQQLNLHPPCVKIPAFYGRIKSPFAVLSLFCACFVAIACSRFFRHREAVLPS